MRTMMTVLERRRVSPCDKFAIPIEKPDPMSIGEPGHILEIETDMAPPPSPDVPHALVRVTRHHGSSTETSISFALYKGMYAAAYEDLGIMTHSEVFGNTLWVPTAQDFYYWGMPYRIESFFPENSRPAFRLQSLKAQKNLRFLAARQLAFVAEMKSLDEDLATFLPYLSSC